MDSMDSSKADENLSTAFFKQASELFEKGKKELELRNEHKNPIILVGLTGSGKSSFAQLVSDVASRIEAVEVSRGEFKTKGEFIGVSNLNSETLKPNIFTISESKMVLIDMGGHGDTRNASHDLAVNCLIKTVTDFADSLKIIFFINYPSVRQGMDRENFMKLMKHITDVVKDIDKFRNGIALIVTKVDNTPVFEGGQWVLVDDKTLTNAIADYLLLVKQELIENLQNNIGADKKYQENAIRIIDILVTKSNENFTKIRLFRRPQQSGPLNESELFQVAKKNFLDLFDSLNYIKKGNNDFGYGISEKSLIVVNDVVDEIAGDISSDFRSIASQVKEHYRCHQGCIHETIEAVVAGINDTESKQTEAKELSSNFKSAIRVIGDLVEEVKILSNNVRETVATVMRSVSLLNIVIREAITSDLMDQVQHLNFLEKVCERKFVVEPCDGTFNNVLLYLHDLNRNRQTHIIEAVKQIEGQIKNVLESLTRAMKNEYIRKTESSEPRSILHMLSKEKRVLSNLVAAISHPASVKELVETFCNIGSDLEISIPENTLENISRFKENIIYFEHLYDKQINIDPTPWLLTLQGVSEFLQECESWYKFLNDLYVKFSDYRIQNVKNTCNVKSIEDWGKSGVAMGIEVTDENFNLFLGKITHLAIAECGSVKNLQFTGLKQQELNHVLNSTLKDKTAVHHTETSVMVKGAYISVKNDLQTILSKGETKSVCLFASNTIFIDQDINFAGKKLSLVVIAPKLEVIGSRNIDVSGKAGDSPPTTYPLANDGQPGKPGGPGGNIVIIGETFINLECLTLRANGGIGGDGQKGKDGIDGEDAVLTDLNSVFNSGHTLPSWAITALAACGKLSRGNATAFVIGEIATKVAGAVLKRNQFVLEAGGRGEDGGNGGKGGFGGRAGKIYFHDLGGLATAVVCCNDDGDNGCDGGGGIGGESGKKKVLTGSEREGIIVELVDGDHCGEDGTEGSNTTGQTEPEPAPILNDFDVVLNDYKTFLKDQLKDRFKKHHLEQFMVILDEKFPVGFCPI